LVRRRRSGGWLRRDGGSRRQITTDPEILTPDEDDEQAEERGPLRRCVVSRLSQPKEAMIRFVIAPDMRVVPDLAQRLPGRGIWLSARGDVLETARARGIFAKVARAPAIAPADLLEQVRAGLVRRIIEHLGLARRAGQAVGGFVKARSWLESGRAGLIVQALDASPDECARLLAGKTIPAVSPLPASDLGAAFGRDHLVHVAIAHGRLAEALKIETGRLAGLSAR